MVCDLNDPAAWELWHAKHLAYVAPAGLVHRRACLERYGYWSEELLRAADYELWMRMMRREPAPNFVYWPIPTSLHFVADWRRQPEWLYRRVWRRLRVRERASLPALQLALAGAASEQAAAWQAMQAAPDEWTDAVRRAIQVDINRRGAFRFTLSDLLEAIWSYGRRARHPRRNWPSAPEPANGSASAK